MIPIEFLRQFRIFDYAIFDLIVAFGGIYLLSNRLSKWCLKLRLEIPQRNWIFLTLPMGIIAHLLCGSMTPMTRNFLDLQGHYMIKIIILVSLIFGLKGIKIVKKGGVRRKKLKINK